MDNNLCALREIQIQRTVKALNGNRFDAHFIPTLEALREKLEEYLPLGASCSVGGSMTLFETGVVDYLRGREDLTFYDRYEEGADLAQVFSSAMNCDVYLASSNAITEDGCLYNVDGTGNRVAAMVYGPKKVVLIAGGNKIVRDMDAARKKMREVAAPANCIRLGLDNPCTKVGHCVDCRTETRTCVYEVAFKMQREQGRIAVLILPDNYGY